jgi:hypothetical protein
VRDSHFKWLLKKLNAATRSRCFRRGWFYLIGGNTIEPYIISSINIRDIVDCLLAAESDRP